MSETKASNSHVCAAAAARAARAYDLRLRGARRSRRCSRSTSAPSSSGLLHGGCSLRGSDSWPKAVKTSRTASKCSVARVSWRPSRSSGAPAASKTASSMLTTDASSMYWLATCNVACRSATSASLAPAASPAARRSSSHASTRGSRDG